MVVVTNPVVVRVVIVVVRVVGPAGDVVGLGIVVEVVREVGEVPGNGPGVFPVSTPEQPAPANFMLPPG